MNTVKKRFVLHVDDVERKGASIKVIGVGGGGSNAVDHTAKEELDGVEFFVANTDAQALARATTANKIQIGTQTTRGFGAGSNPEIGRVAAHEDRVRILEYLSDAEMVFITAGMGGGTGTGAAPVIAQTVKENNPDTLVIAVVTTPFELEGELRMEIARNGLSELRQSVDSLITIDNQRLLKDDDMLMYEAYSIANDVLLNAMRGITEIVTGVGYMNVDFSDVKVVMSRPGATMLGHGRASGDDRAKRATEDALCHSLLSDYDITQAKGVLINITASASTLSSQEYKEIGDIIRDRVAKNVAIIPGQVFQDNLDGEIRVTVVATGLNDPYASEDVLEDLDVDEGYQDCSQMDHESFVTEVESDGETESRSDMISFEHDNFARQELSDTETVTVPSILKQRSFFLPEERFNEPVRVPK